MIDQKIIDLLNSINSMDWEDDDDMDDYSYSIGWDMGRKSLAEEILGMISEKHDGKN